MMISTAHPGLAPHRHCGTVGGFGASATAGT
jgi:hypothetical protein